jgi:hypothetical protein
VIVQEGLSFIFVEVIVLTRQVSGRRKKINKDEFKGDKIV